MANKNTRKKPQNKQTAAADSNWERAKKEATQRSAGSAPARRERTSLKEYFRGVRLEMKKVIWPTKKELGSYTGLVLLSCTIFALLFWAIDSGVLAALRGLLGINM